VLNRVTLLPKKNMQRKKEHQQVLKMNRIWIYG